MTSASAQASGDPEDAKGASEAAVKRLSDVKSLSDPDLYACKDEDKEQQDEDKEGQVATTPRPSEAEDVETETDQFNEEDEVTTASPAAPTSPIVGKKSNSLKRSIAQSLPRNPFTSGKSAKMDHKLSSSSNSGHNHHNHVRNFFNKVVSQIPLKGGRTPLSSSSSAKANAADSRQQEWRKRLDQEGKVPGVVGIRNHGNTCFINAILQCLSYTDILAEYFVLDQYKSDLRKKRRIANLTSFNKRMAANKGEVTEQLATLLKSLWSLQYDPEISIRFKSLVDKHASQYKGGSQHDAQEFLLWLLDQVHEDLNTATKRKYKTFGGGKSGGANGDSRSDEVLAAEALANHIRCNNSFVMDVFQAQFRSSLTCPTCEKQSNTFDPFLCVSLPIPQKQLMPVFVTVLYIDQSPRQVKLGLTIGVHETIADLRRTLAKDTGIEESQILLTEIDRLCFQRTLLDHQPVTVLKGANKAPLYCIEIPKHRETTEDDGAFVVLTWVNVFKEGPIEKRFGSPYTIQVSRETLYCDLQKLLMKEMSSILHDDILIAAQKVPLFKIRVVDGFVEEDQSSGTYLDSEVDLPMYTEAVEQAINLCSLEKGGGPPHVKLVLEWDMPAKSQVINDDTDVIEEHSSVKEVERSPEEATSVTLQECFSLYTSAEKLGQGDAWLCPSCNRKQEVVKKMGLWSLPDVLVIHLKRFRQSSSSTNKLTTMVEFPLEGFDMTPNVTKGPSSSGAAASPGASAVTTSSPESGSTTTSSTSSTLKMLNALSAWKPHKRFHMSTGHHQGHQGHGQSENNVYELYAVCNHHGSDLQGGHYTAYCRNPTDGQWYNFDDNHTKVIAEQDVTTQDAYILFYQRQSLSTSSSASSSSSSSSQQDHWVFRMPDFTYRKKSATSTATTTATTTTTPAANKAKATSSPKSESKGESTVEKSPSPSSSNFTRNSGKYATMPVKKSTQVVECDQEHNSDVEGGMDDDEDNDNETAVDEEARKTAATKAKIIEEDEEDEVARPIDKNDVD